MPGARRRVCQGGDLVDDHSQALVVVLGPVPGVGQDGVDRPAVAGHEDVGQIEDESALAQVDRFVLSGFHDVANGDSLEEEDLGGRLLGDDEFGPVPDQGSVAVGPAGRGGDR